MAKKKRNQEDCIFCLATPCECGKEASKDGKFDKPEQLPDSEDESGGQ